MSEPTKAASSSGATAIATQTPPKSIQEFNIRVPKNTGKRHHVMRFNATLNVDFAQWRNVKLERENYKEENPVGDDEIPKFGAGSEYNRNLREEARRKKLGIVTKKYNLESQPWILKVGDKNCKKFKGIREGGVSEHAAFYVFTHASDGAIEAYPLNEWYNFQPIQRYNTLSAEEAEEAFERREKLVNYFSLMLRKRLRDKEEDEQDPDESKVKSMGNKQSNEFNISEMDEWVDSDAESGSDDEDAEKKEDSGDVKYEKSGKVRKGKKDIKKKKKDDPDDEAFEDSDDGDDEGREYEYDTESSENELDSTLEKEMKGVAEENGLRKLLNSDNESDEQESYQSENEYDSEKIKNDKKDVERQAKDKKKSKASDSDSSTSISFDSNDSENELSNSSKRKQMSKDKANSKNSVADKSRSTTLITFGSDLKKRKSADHIGSENSNSPDTIPPSIKRLKNEVTPTLPSSFAGVINNKQEDCGITEEDVRRYLMRKPLTTTQLLTKFKNKKTGLSTDRLVEIMTKILKKINPDKHTIKGKMYLWLK